MIERAFDYRGDVTVVHRDGSELVGYLFNRNRGRGHAVRPGLREHGGEAVSIPYAEIRSIRFTGRDTAAGNSYAAWLRSREAAKAATARGA